MRVLIVGCGYVGLPLGIELARRGHEVFGLRRRAWPDTSKAPGVAPLTGDITRPQDLARLPGPFDWIVNCVAAGSSDVEDYRRVYLEGTANLLAWLKTASPAKFVYTSSTSVYGQNDGSPVDESSPTAPAAPTAQILVATEQTLLEAARQHRFPAIILRVAGIYGPDRGHALKQFLNGAARLEGKGERILNMIHRDDVADCVIAALEKGRPGEIYNAVDDEPVRQRDFFEWLARTLNRPLPQFTDVAARRKRGETNKKVLNHKLKAELGYRFGHPNFRSGYLEELERLGLLAR